MEFIVTQTHHRNTNSHMLKKREIQCSFTRNNVPALEETSSITPGDKAGNKPGL